MLLRKALRKIQVAKICTPETQQQLLETLF